MTLKDSSKLCHIEACDQRLDFFNLGNLQVKRCIFLQPSVAPFARVGQPTKLDPVLYPIDEEFPFVVSPLCWQRSYTIPWRK